jgi:hypothetical protein
MSKHLQTIKHTREMQGRDNIEVQGRDNVLNIIGTNLVIKVKMLFLKKEQKFFKYQKPLRQIQLSAVTTVSAVSAVSIHPSAAPILVSPL